MLVIKNKLQCIYFNSTIVQLIVFVVPLNQYYIALFQFYYSSINSGYITETTRHLRLFQFYYSSINSKNACKPFGIETDFNSTIVQLIEVLVTKNRLRCTYFNSTIVQLIAKAIQPTEDHNNISILL